MRGKPRLKDLDGRARDKQGRALYVRPDIRHEWNGCPPDLAIQERWLDVMATMPLPVTMLVAGFCRPFSAGGHGPYDG